MLPVHFKRVTIERFKQFKDVVFDLSATRDCPFNRDALTEDGRLVRTALICGRNGSGKTDLGLALMDPTLHLTDNVKDFSLYKYYLNADSQTLSAKFSFEFSCGADACRYEYVKHGPMPALPRGNSSTAKSSLKSTRARASVRRRVPGDMGFRRCG